MSDYLGPYLLGPNDENQGIYTGDARLLAEAVPDESVDLIFTDPVYQNIDDYRWLAETAARVLCIDGALFAAYGVGYLIDVAAALSGLRYRWDFTVFMPNAPSNRGAYRIFCKQWRVMWLDQGQFEFVTHVPDVYQSNGAAAVAWAGTFKANEHEWVKNPEPYLAWLKAASSADKIILDPFTGGGTVPAVCKMLGRRWLAFEINPDTAERARERVRMTQPPLFVMEPEQMEMGL